MIKMCVAILIAVSNAPDERTIIATSPLRNCAELNAVVANHYDEWKKVGILAEVYARPTEENNP